MKRRNERRIDMKKSVLVLLMVTALCATGCGGKKDTADSGAGLKMESISAENSADGAGGSDAQNAESETSESSGDMSGRDLFADFIMGKGLTEVSADFLSANVMIGPAFKRGTEYTISELEDVIAGDGFLQGRSNPDQVSYAPLECHGEFLYAVSLFYDTETEPVTEYLIFSDHSGKLELKFAADAWTRRDISINEAGIVTDSGSNGAGSHSAKTYAPDKSFAYKQVSAVEENYYGFSFYDENGNAIEALNAVIEEAGDGNSAAMDVAYYREVINGKAFYYYLGGNGKITQETVDYIDGISKEHGFTFDGKAPADAARKAYAEELGVSDVYGSTSQPHWKDL